MQGFVEQDLGSRLALASTALYARRLAQGGYVLQIANREGLHELQRQRGGARVFRTFEALIKLLADHKAAEISVLLTEAEITSALPWSRPTLNSPTQGQSFQALLRGPAEDDDSDIPF